MSLVVDLHIHSKYSRSTSKRMDIEHIYQWAKIKGIDVIGTGDFTHPQWFEELTEKLEINENGLYSLKKNIAKKINDQLPASVKDNKVFFMPTAEISNIYSRGEKVRKLHNVLITDSLQTAAIINKELDKIGNIHSDGRPILGMDSRDLLELTLESGNHNIFIPAHIWTPWFAMFGSKSGFDSLKQAFGDLAHHIKATETGLSSDPYMNWRVKELQHLTLVSNSDAHSPEKLGREANLIDTKLNYEQIRQAILTNDQRFEGTIEFYPQEGKYHYDGHRKCNICFSPQESKKNNFICPKCKKPLVLGVNYRIGELANFDSDYKYDSGKKVYYIIPLAEIIAEIVGVKSTNSKKVKKIYHNLISDLGSEFYILKDIPIIEIKKKGYKVIAQAVDRLRKGKVIVKPGYDGVYGVIKVFESHKEIEKILGDQGFNF